MAFPSALKLSIVVTIISTIANCINIKNKSAINQRLLSGNNNKQAQSRSLLVAEAVVSKVCATLAPGCVSPFLSCCWFGAIYGHCDGMEDYKSEISSKHAEHYKECEKAVIKCFHCPDEGKSVLQTIMDCTCGSFKCGKLCGYVAGYKSSEMCDICERKCSEALEAYRGCQERCRQVLESPECQRILANAAALCPPGAMMN